MIQQQSGKFCDDPVGKGGVINLDRLEGVESTTVQDLIEPATSESLEDSRKLVGEAMMKIERVSESISELRELISTAETDGVELGDSEIAKLVGEFSSGGKYADVLNDLSTSVQEVQSLIRARMAGRDSGEQK